MTENRDLALTTYQLLVNATGAHFEEEELAVNILEELINKQKYDFSKECKCDNSMGETWCCNNCGLTTSKISGWEKVSEVNDEDKIQSFNVIPLPYHFYDLVSKDQKIIYRHYYDGSISADRYIDENITHFRLSPKHELPKE